MSSYRAIFKKDVLAWSFYDFANTIYSMNILSLYFKRWVVEDLGRDGLYYDISYALSMLLTGLIMPALGALSDHSRKKKIFLFLFTFLCGVAVGIIPLIPISLFMLIIVVFALSNFLYEGGMVFYNSLLYSVADGRAARLVSGFGVALGYMGSIVGMILVLPWVTGKIFGLTLPGFSAGGKEAAFLPTAILFMLFAVPCFIWVREKDFKSHRQKIDLKKAYREVWEGVKDTRKYPGVLRFLIADYFFEDAVATVILNMGIFSSMVIGFADTDLTLFLIISTVSAMAGSYTIGHFAQNFDLKRGMAIIVAGWIITLLLFIFIDNRPAVYLLGMAMGVFLGGLWTLSRPLLAEMVPREELGRFFGLYSLSGRAAAVVGPVIWGVVVYLFNPSRPYGKFLSGMMGLSDMSAIKLPYRLAVLSLVLMMAMGLYIFRRVPSPKLLQESHD
ncbi:Major facilitator superfamily MFS_1 [Candidatus Zixiibacteriota bacterium]|nr:Major facilitator superfamily MFS_1 [candidate division Zixibacteria bacterium]